MDCTDVNVLLSGLIDDEIDGETRHAAERHLVECKACRDLLNETESLSTLIAQDVASDVDPSGLPADLVGNVLSRTVYADPHANVPGWTNWLGWLAAAAALALAVSIWVMDQQRAVTPDESADVAMPMPISKSIFASAVADEDEYESAVAVASAGTKRSMLPVDAQTLDSASWVLDMLLVADDSSYADVEQIRKIAEYDELLDSLGETRERLEVADQPWVYSAESIVRRIVEGPVDQADIKQMRQTVRQLELSARLGKMSSLGGENPTL